MSAALPTIDGSWSEYVPMLWQALGETIYMVVFAALLTFVLGLLIGVTLFVTSPAASARCGGSTCRSGCTSTSAGRCPSSSCSSC